MIGERWWVRQVTLGELGFLVYTLLGNFCGVFAQLGEDRVLAPEFAISMKHVR